jgi:hypothetical protein
MIYLTSLKPYTDLSMTVFWKEIIDLDHIPEVILNFSRTL